MAIKRITAANENLTNGRSRVEAQHYWAESHGKLVANSAALQRYHHYFSLPEAYDSEPEADLHRHLDVLARQPAAAASAAGPQRLVPGATGRRARVRPHDSLADRRSARRHPRRRARADRRTDEGIDGQRDLHGRAQARPRPPRLLRPLAQRARPARGATPRSQALHSEPRRAGEPGARHQHPRRLV